MRAVVLAMLVSACGGDDVDLSGVYRVDSATGSMPCGSDATISYAAFVRFEQMELFGQPYFAYDGCTDEAATDCDPIGGLLGGFFVPIDDGWSGQTSSSSGGGSSDCTLALVDQTAILQGDGLVIEVSSYSEEVPGLSAAQCDPAEAERRGSDMPCVEHSRVDATKL